MARVLSQEHLNAYKEGGKLNKFFNIIMDDPELSFEIRQNDTVCIYYNKKLILTVEMKKRGGFHFNFKPLNKGYYKAEKETPSWVKIFDDESNWRRQNAIIKYLNNAKLYAYKESRKTEFQLQQNFALGNRGFNSRYVVVDMEWGLPQNNIKKEDQINRTRIDLVIVDTLKNEKGKNDIYLTEVKLGTDSLYGPSGMQDHINQTNIICNNKYACDVLVSDVSNILRQKAELGIINKDLPDLHFEDRPKMLFILGYRSDKDLIELQELDRNLVRPEDMKDIKFISCDTRRTIKPEDIKEKVEKMN